MGRLHIPRPGSDIQCIGTVRVRGVPRPAVGSIGCPDPGVCDRSRSVREVHRSGDRLICRCERERLTRQGSPIHGNAYAVSNVSGFPNPKIIRSVPESHREGPVSGHFSSAPTARWARGPDPGILHVRACDGS